jgi:hypothetical protein
MLEFLPTKDIFFAVLEVFLPTIVVFLVFLKSQKDGIIADLNEAKVHMGEALELLEDCIEMTLEALSPDSAEGRVLTDEEKAESLAVAAKALASLKEVKHSLIKAIPFKD